MSSRRLSVEQLRVLEWGERHRRDLPWRATRDPWAVLVSEVMLQQTQVPRVLDRYQDFLVSYPDPEACATTPLAEVLNRWQGLGYPRRARNLWLTAGACVDRHEGSLPSALDELLALPGIGPYTARAVLAFAFEADVGVADTNIARIMARRSGRSLARRELQDMVDELVPLGRSWDWNETVMDVGALRCRPKAPDCSDCPFRATCAWASAGWPDPDPGVGSAAVSRRQARFEGSDRQARGRLLAALGDAAVTHGAVPGAVGLDDDPERAARVAASLVADGLAVDRGDHLTLP